ncbi:HNH endonuclease [Niallia circulans]|uniref:HNH endonuclease signature motif containing protein n=1 Tax=Niallia circulans TaxID=1397 RepID=UPI001F3B7C13|nr:HNH endonuclease [Niallia circulans]
MQESKKNIQSYQTQIEDLLTLFENYVADTTAYITPISRNSMMRVDRNDIWGNLTQIEWGVTYRLSRAIQETYRSPSLLFSLFDDTDLEERERSRYNKQQLESIRNNMESVQSRLKNKMEELWDLYESKVKKYENTDDEYANKASQVKDRYTTFSEKVSDVISVTAEGAWDFVKGLAVAIYEIAKGLITLVIDAGIVAASGIIPDSIEPDFLKKASTKRIESATETLDAIIHDPAIVLESMAQSITDNAEKEGIMYVSGSAATSFLPYVGQAKYLKLLKGEKSKNKADGIRSAISRKTTETLQRIDGSKKENSLWPNGIKNSGKQYVQEFTHFFRQNFMPHPSFQLSTANQAPVNVWSRATIENRMDSIVPASLRKVEGKGTTKGTVKDKGVSETTLRNIDDFINGNKKFDEVIEDYAKVYKEHVDLNKPWSWDDTIPGGDCLSSAQKRKIKEMAIEKGHIPEIKVTKADGMRYGFADFASAGVVEETVQLPERFWKLSDKEQFKWLDEQIGGTRKGVTWHHTEVPGKMELVPFGIHNITPHNGGRTKGMWADAPR